GKARKKYFDNFPDFSKAETIASFSDYSGDHDQVNYEAFNFLIIDPFTTEKFENVIAELRRTRWKNSSFMQFKSLNKGDRCRNEILPTFLRAADSISGILVTFLIRKDVRFFDKVDGKWPSQILEEAGL